MEHYRECQRWRDDNVECSDLSSSVGV